MLWSKTHRSHRTAKPQRVNGKVHLIQNERKELQYYTYHSGSGDHSSVKSVLRSLSIVEIRQEKAAISAHALEWPVVLP